MLGFLRRRPAEARSWLEERDRRRAEEEDEALRLLRHVRRVEIQSRRLVHDLFSGEYHSVFKGRGIEFAEVREYSPGDDIRMVDRNVTARMRHPFVKIFHEERELTVVFLVDLSGSARFGSRGRSRIEAAAELVAILAFSALANQDKVGCLLFSSGVDKWIPPRKGRSHALRVVREVLAGRDGEERATSIATACESAARVLKRRSIVFLISDFLDDGYEQALALAARRHDVIPLVLTDPVEAELPDVGLVELEDLETGRRRLVDTSDPATRAAHAARMEDRSRRLLPERFRRAGVDPVFLPTDGDMVPPLHQYFRSRARRRGRR